VNSVERRMRAMINPWSTALTRWWCHSAARFALTGFGRRADGRRWRDTVRPTPADAPASGTQAVQIEPLTQAVQIEPLTQAVQIEPLTQAVQIEPLTQADIASAVELAVRVLRVKPGDRGEQFAADITDGLRQMFVAKVNGQVVGYGRVVELAAGEAGPETPAGCYLSGVLVDPAWRGRGIATALTRARLRWAFAHTDTVFCVAGADNPASLHLHAALGFQDVKRFESERSAAGVDVLSQLVRNTATLRGGSPASSGWSPYDLHRFCIPEPGSFHPGGQVGVAQPGGEGALPDMSVTS
jgi:ribosomal protein S18 acetylase RimI-like enzyme